jgi:hypothetical protein
MKSIAAFLLPSLALALLVDSTVARPRRNEHAPESGSAPSAQSSLPPPDDTARFLAGMPLDKNSPLAALTEDPAWQEHSAFFEKAFAKLNTRQLMKLRKWQDTYLPASKENFSVAYYMFSGPDFLYLDQFFPNASTYIMCGKEALGPPPDPLRITNLSAALHNLEYAMNSSLTTSYFITKDMKVDLQQQNLNGTMPILYVFLARAGKSINEVAYVSLDRGGAVHESRPGAGGTPGVRITYHDQRSGRAQTLYYFTTDISDGGITANPGFMSFCDHFGVGASFLKSSSYLMFESGFGRVRDFILDHSQLIVQDDSGIPLSSFNRSKWNLRLFGTYVGPIELFKQHDQPALHDEFSTSNPPPVTFGFGYQYNFHKANLIVAERN